MTFLSHAWVPSVFCGLGPRLKSVHCRHWLELCVLLLIVTSSGFFVLAQRVHFPCHGQVWKLPGGHAMELETKGIPQWEIL